MTEYTLPALDSIVGEFTFTLYCDTAGLTVPTIQTIKEIGESSETMDLDIGLSQFANLTFTLRDDYSTYDEGFWYKVLSVGWRLRIYLDGDFYFFGIPQEEQVLWSELYVDSTSQIREAEVTMVSIEAVLFETPTEDWLDEIYANKRTAVNDATSTIYTAVNLEEFFAALLSASGLNASYDATTTDILFQTADFIYHENANEWDVDQLYIPVEVSSSSVVSKTGYFDSGHADYLAGYFPKAAGLFSAVLRNFGLVARASYDTSGERHLLQLIQRARSQTAFFTGADDTKKSSTITKAFTLLGDAARAKFLVDDTSFVWFSKKYQEDASPSSAEPPDYVTFDLDIVCPFIHSAVIATDKAGYALHGGAAITSAVLIDDVEYYNYTSEAFVDATLGILEAAAGYEFYRFTSKFSRIVRRYSDLMNAGGASIEALRIGIGTTIDDGVSSETYFANRVTRIPMDDEIEMEWIKQ